MHETGTIVHVVPRRTDPVLPPVLRLKALQRSKNKHQYHLYHPISFREYKNSRVLLGGK